MYNKIKPYFDISRREYRGMIVIFVIFILIYIFPYVYEKIIWSPLEYKVEELVPYVEEIESFNGSKTKLYNNDKEVLSVVEGQTFFDFNPNNLPVTEWVKLGLSEKQANIIKKYEEKGGKFYKKEDLKRIYSISEQQYARLEPYIKIPVLKTIDVKQFKKETIQHELLPINSVDSFSIQLIKGIGPAFASRIIKYRDRLGGFVNKEQLREVYGIDSVKFDQISSQIEIDANNITTININTITFEDFKGFPYLTNRQKNVLLAYRKQHGGYTALSELKKAAFLSSETVEKIAPYIKFDDRK